MTRAELNRAFGETGSLIIGMTSECESWHLGGVVLLLRCKTTPPKCT